MNSIMQSGHSCEEGLPSKKNVQTDWPFGFYILVKISKSQILRPAVFEGRHIYHNLCNNI